MIATGLILLKLATVHEVRTAVELVEIVDQRPVLTWVWMDDNEEGLYRGSTDDSVVNVAASQASWVCMWFGCSLVRTLQACN